MIPYELFSKRSNASKNPKFKNVLEFNWAIHNIVQVNIPEIHNGGSQTGNTYIILHAYKDVH